MTNRTCAIALAITAACGLAGCDMLVGAQGHLSRAQEDLKQNNAYTSVIEARKSLAKDTSNPKAWLTLADASLLQNDSDTAADAVDKARADNADPVDLASREWELMVVKGQYKELLKALDTNKAEVPAKIRARYLGLARLGTQDFPGALTVLENPDLKEDTEAVIGHSRALFALGRPDAAIDLLKAAGASDPKNARYRVALGEVLLSRGFVAQAENTFLEATRLSSVQSDTQTWVAAEAGAAKSALAQGKLPAAKHAVEALNKDASKLLVTRILKARLALAQGHLQEAVSSVQPIVAAIPDEVEAHMVLAFATFQEGFAQQAQTSLDAVLTAHPDYAPARKLLTQIQISTNRLDEAQHTLDPLLKNNSDPDVLALAGRISMAQRNSEQADSYYTRALTDKGLDDSTRYDIALTYLKEGKLDRAVEILKTLPEGSQLAKKRDLLLALSTKNTDPHAIDAALDVVAQRYSSDLALQRTVAQLHAQHGDLNGASGLLNAMLKNNPNDVDTLLLMANVQNSAHRADEADKYLHQILTQNPKNVAALSGLAHLAEQRNDVKGFIDNLDAARAADKSAVAPRLELVRYYLAKNNETPDPAALDAARPVMKEALTIAPKQVEVVQLAADLEYVSGHMDAAITLLKNGATQDPTTAPLWLALSNLQLKTKQMAAAQESLNRALSLRQGWLPAVRAQAEMFAAAGDTDRALRVIQDAREVPGMNETQSAEQRAGSLELEGELLVSEIKHDKSLQTKLLPRAITAFSQAYAAHASSTSATAVMQLRSLIDEGHAEDDAVNWLSLHPQDVKLRDLLAGFYLAHKDHAKAISIYESGIAAGVSSPAQLNNLAWLYFEAKDPRALPTAQQALKASGNQPEMLDTVGWILVQQGKSRDAFGYIQGAAQKAPKNPDIAYHYAYVLSETGQEDAARGVLASLLAPNLNFNSRKDAETLNAALSSKVFK